VRSWKRYLRGALAPLHRYLLATLPKPYAIVLMYHEIARDSVHAESWMVIRESDFLRQIEYLLSRYDIVDLDHAIAHMQARTVSPRPMALITFDDGNCGNATLLRSILERLGLPVTMYIATRHVAERRAYWFDRVINAVQGRPATEVDLRAFGIGRYQINRLRGKANWRCIHVMLEAMKSLAPDTREDAVESVLSSMNVASLHPMWQAAAMSVDDVRAVAACPLVTIGAHSHCHNILPQLNPEDIQASVEQSKKLLEEWSGTQIAHFAYPNGAYSEEVTNIVRRAGFRSAATTTPTLWTWRDSVFHIPRLGVGRYDSMDEFKYRLSSASRRLARPSGAVR